MRHNDGRSSTGNVVAKTQAGSEVFESLIVVSNRQPYRHEYADDEGEATPDGGQARNSAVTTPDRQVTVDRPTGGLTAGLDPVLEDVGGTWIAWGDGDADRAVTDESGCVPVPPENEAYTLQRVWLPETATDGYYYGFSNQVLWPLCHGFVDLLEFRPAYLEWYREVNGRFADAVAEHARADSVVWLQDYHLALAPAMIREKVPQSTTVAQFWHVPWPSAETFRHCPGGRELLTGLLGNDMLGFHIDAYRTAFLDCVERFLPGAVVDRRRGVVSYEGRETQVVATPMGVDVATYDERAREATGAWSDFCESHDIPPENTIALGVDRLDYTKGIPARIEAIERTLERWPELRGSLVLVQTATPSRTNIPAYAEHGERVRDAVDRVNDRFRTDEWEPIVYTETYIPRPTLCTLYRRADIMLVTSHSDGMNLVAKEFVASSVDDAGALCLSDQTGAAEQLGDLAYTVDPDDPDAIASTIDEVLSATSEERRHRMQTLRERVHRQDIDWWMDQQFEALGRVGSERRLPPTGLSVADRR